MVRDEYGRGDYNRRNLIYESSRDEYDTKSNGRNRDKYDRGESDNESLSDGYDRREGKNVDKYEDYYDNSRGDYGDVSYARLGNRKKTMKNNTILDNIQSE